VTVLAVGILIIRLTYAWACMQEKVEWRASICEKVRWLRKVASASKACGLVCGWHMGGRGGDAGFHLASAFAEQTRVGMVQMLMYYAYHAPAYSMHMHCCCGPSAGQSQRLPS
jgi:hypothetical protein